MLADRQTHARGSRGRDWTTLPGSLALSVLLRPGGPANDSGHWALLAAVAMIGALDRPDAALKWPNDIMLDGRKLGGVLIDTALDGGSRLDWLVIGFGLNLGAAPSLPDRATASIPGTPAAIAGIEHWDRTRLIDGFGPVRRAWLDRGPAPGEWLRVRVGSHEIGGAFAGLDDSGALLLHSGGRVHAVPTGEILQAKGE